MELQNGRPASLEGREEKEIKVYDLLDRLGIEYLRTDHEAAGTIADCLEVDQVLGITICKNLFLCNRQKTEFYLLMMPDPNIQTVLCIGGGYGQVPERAAWLRYGHGADE